MRFKPIQVCVGGKVAGHDTEGRAWAYSEYWPTKILSKLRKFYPTIEGVDRE